MKFQFTHPCGCDRRGFQACRHTRGFNSRTRVGATVSARYVRGEGWVSIHAPVWVRLVVAGEAVKNYDVSIHAPVWVRQTEPKPEAQEEEVSIHAPVWVRRSFVGKRIFIFGFNSRTRVGATPADELATSIYTVSIHAPVWVRPYMTELSFWFRRFQFTHPCGCDCGLVTVESVDKVSIHAPVWVRPSGMRLGYVKRWVSIHAPVWVRLKSGFGTYFFLRFQFTHPCGCDSWVEQSYIHDNRFNSRTRVGATVHAKIIAGIDRVSIHAPVWVRPAMSNSPIATARFQFTHPCGCDDVFPTPLSPVRSFNSRTRVGATDLTRADASNWGGFNSRTRVGATYIRHAPGFYGSVSIHAPVWVRLDMGIPIHDMGEFQFTHPCGCDL